MSGVETDSPGLQRLGRAINELFKTDGSLFNPNVRARQ